MGEEKIWKKNCVKISARILPRSSCHSSYDADPGKAKITSAGLATQVGQIAYQLMDAKKKGNSLTPLQMALSRPFFFGAGRRAWVLQATVLSDQIGPANQVVSSSKMVSGRFVIPSPDRDHLPLRLSGSLRRLLSGCRLPLLACLGVLHQFSVIASKSVPSPTVVK